jgi:hypothetical protein
MDTTAAFTLITVLEQADLNKDYFSFEAEVKD